jgi:uncharacterized membrane protein
LSLTISQQPSAKTGLNARYATIAIAALIVGYAVVMGVAAWYKYEHFGYGYDQVDFEQAVWATTQGRPFFDSRFNFTNVVFGMDFMPALGAFLPFYAIFPSPHTMNLLETVTIALGALPVYWLARDVIGSRIAGLAFAATYLLYPTIEYVNLFPDYMRPLAVTLLLFAIYYLYRRRLLPTLLFAFAALLTRTDVALTVAMLGVYALLIRPVAVAPSAGRDKSRPYIANLRFGLPLLIGGLLYFFISVYLLVPSFTYPCANIAGTNIVQTNRSTVQPTATPIPTGAEEPGSNGCGQGSNFLIGYYSHLGGATSFGDVVKYVITHPLDVARLVFTGPKLWYVLLMLLPGALLVLLYPPAWLLLLPTFALNLLTNRSSQLDSQTHYQMLLIPGLMLGVVFGFAQLRRWLSKDLRHEARGMSEADATPNSTGRVPRAPTNTQNLLLLLPVAAALVVNIMLGNPLLSAFRYGESSARIAAANSLIAMVPQDAGVAVTSSLGPHLLPRLYIYNFPPAPYTPYDSNYRFPPNTAVANAPTLAYIIADENAAVLKDGKALTALRTDPNWAVVAEQERFILFKHKLGKDFNFHRTYAVQ